eukprot:CAMPEP_0170625270 /NCGR_PEP_ID=MMETSP0224-20130122/30668_1 /TAXON_ID=285029 /ORGANISM="Togula jolla, Strain CCCM 725" /LENGTH=49 /DNA_ID= /DNA_START= /DNA_END= /DNA_ORIENTATION=
MTLRGTASLSRLETMRDVKDTLLTTSTILVTGVLPSRSASPSVSATQAV